MASLLLARLTRIVPLMVAMAVLAAILYMVITFRHSPARAKEVLLKVFLWLNGAITAFFGLFSLYALFESNESVFELSFAFAIVGAIGLLITLWRRLVFLRENPNYRKRPMKAETKRKKRP